MDFQSRIVVALDGLAGLCSSPGLSEALEELAAIVAKGPDALQDLKLFTDRIESMTPDGEQDIEQEQTATDESPPPEGPASTPEVSGGDDSSDDKQDDPTDPGVDENVAPV